MGRPKLELAGKRFGRLVAIEDVGRNEGSGVLWRCRCDCGGENIVEASQLVSGSVRSCGCLGRELAAERLKHFSRKTHGESYTRLHRIWGNMKTRCTNPKSDHYDRYGGRGITVCEEWRNSYEKFRDWAIPAGYADDLTLERINNDGPYCPENCRWATKKEQASNRSSNRVLTFNEESHTMKEWAEITGIRRLTIKYRIDNLNWPIEKALTTPMNSRKEKNNV